MTDHILEKLASLGLTLPAVPAPVAAYVNCVRSGNLLFLSGGLPIDGDRKVIGKVPTEVSIDEATEGARIIILNRLAVIRDDIGSLDKVKQIVALNGFVNSEAGLLRPPPGHQRRLRTARRNLRRQGQTLPHRPRRRRPAAQRRGGNQPHRRSRGLIPVKAEAMTRRAPPSRWKIRSMRSR